MGQAFADGSMIDAGGLYPTTQSIEIRLDGGTITQVDGPCANVWLGPSLRRGPRADSLTAFPKTLGAAPSPC